MVFLCRKESSCRWVSDTRFVYSDLRETAPHRSTKSTNISCNGVKVIERVYDAAVLRSEYSFFQAPAGKDFYRFFRKKNPSFQLAFQLAFACHVATTSLLLLTSKRLAICSEVTSGRVYSSLDSFGFTSSIPRR